MTIEVKVTVPPGSDKMAVVHYVGGNSTPSKAGEVRPGGSYSFYAHDQAAVFVQELAVDSAEKPAVPGRIIRKDDAKPLYGLGDKVTIKISGEQGMISARARYLRATQPSYLVEYKAADGRATEGWFSEDQLRP